MWEICPPRFWLTGREVKLETIQKSLSKHVPSAGEQKGNLTPITWWRRLLTRCHHASNAPLLLPHACVIFVTLADEVLGKSWDHCNDNLMGFFSRHFALKEKQTGSVRSYKLWARDSNTKSYIAPLWRVTHELPLWPLSKSLKKTNLLGFFGAEEEKRT